MTLSTKSNHTNGKQTENDLRVVIVSSSQAEKSRSRMAANYAQECLKADQISVDFLELRERTVLGYPHSKGEPDLTTLVERFDAADAWILAVPVYNWGPSGILINFLHYALKNNPEKYYRPFVILAGAGGQKAFLALDGLARTMVYESSAVQVGPAILAAGSDADRDTAILHDNVKVRIKRAMAALATFALASPAYRQRQTLRMP